MRKILPAAIVCVALTAGLPLEAATPAEFYASLLRRGIAAYDAGRNEEAARNLRLAAFGFVESVEQYQIAHTYLALTYDRLKDAERALDSVRRVLRAERVERRFGSIAFPPAVRSAFQTLAAKALTPAEVELLRSSPANASVGTGAPARPTPQPQTASVGTGATARPAPAEAAGATPTRPQTASVGTGAPARPAPAEAAGATPSEVASRLAAAERALTAAQLAEARRIYRELLNANGVDRATLIRVAEGFYRARDFASALAAFERVGALRRGEEPYRYYIAVALYETGQYAKARQELAAALPFIEVTPDVARYRAKIEGAAP